MRAQTLMPKNQYGAQQRAIMVAIGDQMRRQNVPPLDRGLRSIVVGMVANLLKGGYPFEEVRHVAVELSLDFDLYHGHKALLSLQQVVQQRDHDLAEAEHRLRMRTEHEETMDPKVAAILGERARHYGWVRRTDEEVAALAEKMGIPADRVRRWHKVA